MDASDRRFFVILYVTYFLLALLFNAFTPIGESPDELEHYRYVRILHEEQRLPNHRDSPWLGQWGPVYYVGQTFWAHLWTLMTGCEIRADRLPFRPNPRFPKGGDYTILIHSASERLSNWGCTEFSFHFLRLFSAILTVLGIAVTVRLLAEVLPSSDLTVKLAATFMALVPGHVFISTMVNNDALVNVLIIFSMYYMVRAFRKPDIGNFVRALVAVALGVATKLSAIFLFPLLVLLLFLRRDILQKIATVRFNTARAWVVLAIIALPGVLFVRNYLEWGDPFAVSVLETLLEMLKKAGAHPEGSIMHFYFREFPVEMVRMLLVSYGPINFSNGPALARLKVYGLAIATGVVVSFVWQRGLLWRSAAPAPLLFLILGFGLFFATYFYPGYRYRMLQARYFFNQLPLLSLVAGIGITALWQQVKRVMPRLPDSVIVYGHYGFLVLMNALVLTFGVIDHQYRYIGVMGS